MFLELIRPAKTYLIFLLTEMVLELINDLHLRNGTSAPVSLTVPSRLASELEIS